MNFKLIKVLHIEKINGCRERAAQKESHSVGLVPERVFTVTIVKDSYQAFDQIALKNYDVIVIHEDVEDMNAHETAMIIRNGDKLIPLLLLAPAGETCIEYKLNCLQQTGFSHVLIEPYTDDDYFFAIAAMQQERSDGNPAVTAVVSKSKEIEAIKQLALERYMKACKLRNDSESESRQKERSLSCEGNTICYQNPSTPQKMPRYQHQARYHQAYHQEHLYASKNMFFPNSQYLRSGDKFHEPDDKSTGNYYSPPLSMRSPIRFHEYGPSPDPTTLSPHRLSLSLPQATTSCGVVESAFGVNPPWKLKSGGCFPKTSASK